MPKLHYLMILFILSVAPLLTHSQDGEPHIIASHSILSDVVAQVVGDVTQVIVVMPVGADPHSFQVTPTDLTAVATADIVFVNGAFFEEGLLEAIENAGTDMKIIEVSSCVEIIPVGASEHAHDEGDDHEHDEDGDHDMQATCNQHIAEVDNYHDHEHHDEEHDHTANLGRLYTIHCGEDHEAGENHAHAEGGCDPHVWMNPENVMYWTLLIRDTLIEFDPARADIYTDNAAAYIAELDALLEEIELLVDTLPEEKRILITSHDSLGYLATHFDFELIGTIIPGGSTVAEPSVRDVAQLIDLINAEGVPAIFGESTVNASIAQTIATETGAELVVLYSGSLSDANNPASTYIDYMRYNITAIVTALSQ